MNDVQLSIQVEEHDDHAVIRPEGYLNALTGDQVDKVCSGLIEKGIHYFIINFSEVSMVNTIGISILVGIIEKVTESDGMLYFTELGETDRQIFEVLNLTTVAMLFQSDEDARGHLEHDKQAVERARGFEQEKAASETPAPAHAEAPAPEQDNSSEPEPRIPADNDPLPGTLGIQGFVPLHRPSNIAAPTPNDDDEPFEPEIERRAEQS